MSGLTTGVTGAIALLLISGAAQFAMGRDLSTAADQLPPIKQSSPGSSISDTLVNRGAKADPCGRTFRLAGIFANDFTDAERRFGHGRPDAGSRGCRGPSDSGGSGQARSAQTNGGM